MTCNRKTVPQMNGKQETLRLCRRQCMDRRHTACNADANWTDVLPTSRNPQTLAELTLDQCYNPVARVEYVERPETLMRHNVVIVWLQCLLVDALRHIGPTLAPADHDHVDICSPKQRPCR